jgi:hypothetical protein
MDAFRVICDETNNPPEEIARNRLHATIQYDIRAFFDGPYQEYLKQRLSKALLEAEERRKAMIEIKCLICGKVLVPIESEFPDKDYWRQNFSGANAWEVHCDYGSTHDTDKFVFGLCDECISIKKEAGWLIPNGNIIDDVENTLW